MAKIQGASLHRRHRFREVKSPLLPQPASILPAPWWADAVFHHSASPHSIPNGDTSCSPGPPSLGEVPLGLAQSKSGSKPSTPPHHATHQQRLQRVPPHTCATSIQGLHCEDGTHRKPRQEPFIRCHSSRLFFNCVWYNKHLACDPTLPLALGNMTTKPSAIKALDKPNDCC